VGVVDVSREYILKMLLIIFFAFEAARKNFRKLEKL
jgi:hypothetical protein